VIPLKAQRKETHKSGVYRLRGAGEGGADLIAKRSRAKKALRERVVYEQLMPMLPLERLGYYGFVDEPDGANTWLFIEDAGTEACSAGDRIAFIEWLGRLHTSASRIARPAELAERGPSRYREHLDSARQRIIANLGASHFLSEEREVQHRILRLLDLVEHHWDELTLLCKPFPQTLVHGDLSGKNLRVRRDAGGAHFFALDWETAGWAIPAADLDALAHDSSSTGALRVETYLSTVQRDWKCSRREVEQLAHVGLVFRMTAAIDWVSYSLPYAPARKPVRYLASYERYMLSAASGLGWDSTPAATRRGSIHV
jgi:hypothetical protein